MNKQAAQRNAEWLFLSCRFEGCRHLRPSPSLKARWGSPSAMSASSTGLSAGTAADLTRLDEHACPGPRRSCWPASMRKSSTVMSSKRAAAARVKRPQRGGDSSPRSSRASHALARRQSRITVCGET